MHVSDHISKEYGVDNHIHNMRQKRPIVYQKRPIVYIKRDHHISKEKEVDENVHNAATVKERSGRAAQMYVCRIYIECM